LDFHRLLTGVVLLPVWLSLLRRDREHAACGLAGVFGVMLGELIAKRTSSPPGT
jgi:hypothetical protein